MTYLNALFASFGTCIKKCTRPSKMYTENGQCLNPPTTKHMSQPHKPLAPFESATRQREVSAA
jgi:hypothetical protein